MSIKHTLAGILAIGILGLPLVSSAQSMTITQLQTQIASLTAEVQALQQQLALLQGGNPSWCYTFNDNLSTGMTGPTITALQTALQKNGESINITGAFDGQTSAAVTNFQQKYASQILAPDSLQNGTGYVGSLTRSELTSLFGCHGPIPIPAPVPTSTAPIACPMLVPYCRYGSYSIPGNNGCYQTICNPAPTSTPPTQASITVLSPGINAQWSLGSTQTITWVPTSTVSNVNITVGALVNCPMIPAGSTTASCSASSYTIATAVPDTGSYSWTIPTTISAPAAYVVRISDTGSSGLTGQSGEFNIAQSGSGQTQPTITAISPSIASIGTQVTIIGTGFSAENTVLFGGIRIGSYPSNNGTSISLQIPSFVQNRPVCSLGEACPEWIGVPMPIEPGVIEVTVANNTTSSNAFPLTIVSSTSE